MVTPMIKYTFLLHHNQRDILLEQLGMTAIVDVTVSSWIADEKDKTLISDIQRISQIEGKLIIASAVNKKREDPLKPAKLELSNVEEMISIYENATAKQEQLASLVPKYIREIDELSIWGDFDCELISKLESEGLYVHYYTISSKHFNQSWLQDFNLVECNNVDNTIYFVIVDSSSEPFELDRAYNLKPFKHSANEREADLKRVHEEIDSAQERILAVAENLKDISEYNNCLIEQLSERKVLQTTLSVADGELLVVEGFAPKGKTEGVDKLFESNSSIIVLKDNPTPEDNPPVLLRNNKFARLSEMITRLYSLPNYNELDLTPFFAPFFVFFVGICMGDLGYGIILFLCSLGAYFKFKNSEYSSIAMLAVWCSVTTIIMGVVTGTFFGIQLAETQLFSGLPFLGSMDMFTFALVVGIIQILYATFIKAIFAIKSYGWMYGVPTLAWAFIIILSLAAYMGGEMKTEFNFSSPIYTAGLISLLAVFVFFSNPAQRNPLKNIGGGIWNLYNGATGILGDVLSYIRLFALGLSSGIIGGVFNDLAVGMSPDIPVVKYLVMIIILLLGHGINLFMSLISSFVHPLRLTFVEFYKSAGFEGGGRAYQPFKKTNK